MLGCDSPFIQIENVSVCFGSIEAVRDVSLHVMRGTILGLVGSDGAGKSTLIRTVATMIKPSRGRILIDGFDVTTEKRKIKNIIGYMPQRFGLYEDLTVGENFDFFLDVFRIKGKERERKKEKYLGFSKLLPFIDRPVKNLSGGMKQKLGLACALVHNPQLLILDEPTNGVDPVSRQELWHMLSKMKEEGLTIFIATAYLDEGEKCDYLALMHRARLLDTATPVEIRSRFSHLEEAMKHRIQEFEREMAHEHSTE